MRLDYLEDRLANFFFYYGHVVHLRAVTFIAIPVLLSLLICSRLSLLFDPYSDNAEFYAPSRYGLAADSLDLLDKYFPMNETDSSYAIRRTDERRMGRILLATKENCSSIVDRLNNLVEMIEVLGLWKAIFDISVYDNHRTDDYSTLCITSPQRDVRTLKETQARVDFESGSNTTTPISIPLTNQCLASPLLAVTYHLVYPIYNLSYPIDYIEYLGNLYIGDLVGGIQFTQYYILPATPVTVSTDGTTDTTDNSTLGGTNTIENSTLPSRLRLRRDANSSSLTDDILATTSAPDLCYQRENFANNTDGYGYNENVSVILYADAIALPYMLQYQNPIVDDNARQWELKLSEFLQGLNSSSFDVAWWTSETLNEEIDKHVEEPFNSHLIGMLILVLILILLFSSSLDENCSPWSVRAKYFEAIGALVTVVLAVVTGAILMRISGQPAAAFAKLSLFIIIPIGVSYYFILLAAWRDSDLSSSVGDRTAQSLKNVGVPLLMFAIVDILCFGFGIYSQYPVVHVFCSYATMCIALLPAFVFTMLVGVLMLGGRREAKFRQSLCCCDMPASLVESDSVEPCSPHQMTVIESEPKKSSKKLEQWAFTTWQPDQRQVHHRYPPRRRLLPNFSSGFFGGFYARVVVKSWIGRIIVMLAYAAYVAGAVFGSLKLSMAKTSDSPLARALPRSSYGQNYIRLQEKYFTNYSDAAHLFYDHLDEQKLNMDFLHKLDADVARLEQRCADHVMLSHLNHGNWLRHFLKFASLQDKEVKKNSSASDVNALMRQFFANASLSTFYQRDVVFTEDGLRLSLSRFALTLRNVGLVNRTVIMRCLQGAAAASQFKAYVYHPSFLLVSEHDVRVRNLLQTILPGGAVVLLISCLLLPHPVVALATSLTTVSIVFGIIGYMTLWRVELYFASLAVIFLAVGFSSHFPILFAYQTLNGLKTLGKVNECLSVGLQKSAVPILQSAFTMVFASLITLGIPWHPAITLIKIVLLATLFSVFHALLVLPAVLAICLKPKWCFTRRFTVNVTEPEPVPNAVRRDQ